MANADPIIRFPRSSGDGSDGVKVVPQSLEAEQSTLGAMLLDRDAIARAAEKLTPEDFYREGHRMIFSAILHLFDHGDPADIVTVTNELRRRGQLEPTGGAPYLMALMENCPAAANVEQYAAIVEEKSILRGLLTAADQIQGWVYEGADSLETLIDRAEQSIFRVGQRRLSGDFFDLKSLLHDAFEQIESQFKHKGRATGIPTGFDDLDRLTSGLQPSDLVIVAARPSMGKTSLCLGIGHHVAVHEKLPVAVFSLEMSKSQLVQRLICAEARVDSHKFRSGYLDENDWNKIAGAVERLYDAPIFIDDTPAISTFEMRAKVRRLKAEHGNLGLVIVDYLQLARTSRRAENRTQEVSEIARSLKSMARELNCPLMALSQLSRAVEQREDKRPQLSDLRESGCLSGDTLVFLPDEGTYCPIAELEGKSGFHVLAVNPQTWKLEPCVVQKAFATGYQPVYRLTAQSGRTIRATANHKFLTIAGWKRLDELSVGEHIALPRCLPSPQRATMSEDELALLGHLIGDGSTLPRRGSWYTTGELALAETVAQLANRVFGNGVVPRIIPEPHRNRYEVGLMSAQRLTHGKRNPVTTWLRGLGVWGLRSFEKEVPVQVFTQPAQHIAHLLRHLWATDGCIHLGNKGHAPAIYYASSSEQLARQVQSLLLRLDIQASLSRHPQPHKGRDQFHVNISGKPGTERFLSQVGALGQSKERHQAAILNYYQDKGHNPNRDVIPREAWRLLVVPALKEAGLTTRQMHAGIGVHYCGSTLYKANLSRQRAGRVARLVGSEELLRLSQSDVYWDRIAAIEYDGETDVYDLTVEGLHNFVANDIIAHNSIEAEADLVMFIHRQAYHRHGRHKDKEDERGRPPAEGEVKAEAEGRLAEIIIGKQRNGPTGTVRLVFLPEYAKFENYAPMQT